MSSGFVEYTATHGTAGNPALGATYQVHKLQKPSAVTSSAWFQDLPTGNVVWSHIEIIIECASGTFAGDIGIAASGPFLSWDVGGNQIAAGPPQGSASLVLVQGGTTTQRAGMVLTFDVVPTTPFQLSGVERNEVYLWLTCNKTSGTGTPELIQARLYWHELNKG
tara:strand:+ start:523 stop:1017 length:495 start_codon:yes stop_codon:yes gene_type:complete